MQATKYKLAVCGILIVCDMILLVSRKDDHTKFGLIGGKVDENESIQDALIREVFEETGLNVSIEENDKSVFVDYIDDYKVYCYVIRLNDVTHTQTSPNETGLVRLKDMYFLLDENNSNFVDYNKKVLEHYGFI